MPEGRGFSFRGAPPTSPPLPPGREDGVAPAMLRCASCDAQSQHPRNAAAWRNVGAANVAATKPPSQSIENGLYCLLWWACMPPTTYTKTPNTASPFLCSNISIHIHFKQVELTKFALLEDHAGGLAVQDPPRLCNRRFSPPRACAFIVFLLSLIFKVCLCSSCGSALTFLISGLALMDIMLASDCNNHNMGKRVAIEDPWAFRRLKRAEAKSQFFCPNVCNLLLALPCNP